jgi:hypothetical protein
MQLQCLPGELCALPKEPPGSLPPRPASSPLEVSLVRNVVVWSHGITIILYMCIIMTGRQEHLARMDLLYGELWG